MNGEIVDKKQQYLLPNVKTVCFSIKYRSNETKLLLFSRRTIRSNFTTINAERKVFAGAKASDEQKNSRTKYPRESQFFARSHLDPHLPQCIYFTINIKHKS
jgi:hypothetical protein